MTETGTHSKTGGNGPAAALAACGVLVGATAALWLALVAGIWGIGGSSSVESVTAAALLCLVPGVIVLGVKGGLSSGEPSPLWLAATPFRLIIVLAGALWLRSARAELSGEDFLIWVVVFYLATLLVETVLMVRRRAGLWGMTLSLFLPRR